MEEQREKILRKSAQAANGRLHDQPEVKQSSRMTFTADVFVESKEITTHRVHFCLALNRARRLANSDGPEDF